MQWHDRALQGAGGEQLQHDRSQNEPTTSSQNVMRQPRRQQLRYDGVQAREESTHPHCRGLVGCKIMGPSKHHVSCLSTLSMVLLRVASLWGRCGNFLITFGIAFRADLIWKCVL